MKREARKVWVQFFVAGHNGYRPVATEEGRMSLDGDLSMEAMRIEAARACAKRNFAAWRFATGGTDAPTFIGGLWPLNRFPPTKPRKRQLTPRRENQ